MSGSNRQLFSYFNFSGRVHHEVDSINTKIQSTTQSTVEQFILDNYATTCGNWP